MWKILKLDLIEPKNKSTYIVNACLDTCERICAAPTMLKELAGLLNKTKTKDFKGSTDILQKILEEKGSLTLNFKLEGKELIITPVKR